LLLFIFGDENLLAFRRTENYHYCRRDGSTHLEGGLSMQEDPSSAFGVKGVKKYYSIGDTIARAGEPAEGWYILLSGKVGVFKRDFTIAEVANRGTVFGELGCILGVPRTATLQALEPTVVLFVQMGIDEVVVKHPEFAKRILISLAERLATTTDAWWASVEKMPRE
jgi:CRP-like cAMP-binding protein